MWQREPQVLGQQEWKWLVTWGRREACSKMGKALGVKQCEAWKNPEKTSVAGASKCVRMPKQGCSRAGNSHTRQVATGDTGLRTLKNFKFQREDGKFLFPMYSRHVPTMCIVLICRIK